MGLRLPIGWACVWLALIASPVASQHAQAVVEPLVTCLESHEAAQVQRLGGHRLQARGLLQACASEACPALVREDCARWLVELRAEIPSVIFEVLTDRGPARNASVLENGETIATQLDGQPLELDAGLHTFEVKLEGQPAQTISVLVREGERGKLVSVDFRVPVAGPTLVAPAASTRTKRDARRVPLLSYVLSGVALAALGNGVGFGVDASDRQSSARTGSDACAPSCSGSRVDAIQSSALVADVSFSAALVATAGALLAYFAQPDAPATDSTSAMLAVTSW